MPVVILDEVSALKEGEARYTAVLNATSTAGRVHAFTATLYENDPMEVWRIYSLLHVPRLPTKRDFGNEFVEWRVYETNDQPWAWANADAAARFRELTAAHYFRREDCLEDLRRPEYVRHDVVCVPLSPAQSQGMNRIDREWWGLNACSGTRRSSPASGCEYPSTARRSAHRRAGRRDRTAKILVVAESILEVGHPRPES